MNTKHLPHGRAAALLAVLALLIVAVVARGQAGTERPQAAQANSRTFLPVVTKPKPLTVKLVPFVMDITGSDTITDIVQAGDSRLFVVLREGLVRIVYPDGTIDPTPFMDITRDVATEANWEQGLLGLAFHPQFPAEPHVYVVYTDNNNLRVARASLDKNNPNVINRSSLISLMVIEKPRLNNNVGSPVHNGGDLAFGPDGYLFIPVGDGGPDPYLPEGVPGDPYNNSQRRDELLGGILRINVDEAAERKLDCGEDLYSVPNSNPFLGNDDCDEIWMTGLRNPWRMSFDKLTGDMYISDVGEWQFEEINLIPAGAGAGANLGWHCYEGTFHYAGAVPEFAPHCGPETDYVFPLYQYTHDQGECSVTGGYVYRGQKFPTLFGRYLFTDFCSGRMWALGREGAGWKVQQVGTFPIGITTFGQDVNGELYVGTWDDPFNIGEPAPDLYKLVVAP